MKIISQECIESLDITDMQIMEWVNEALLQKSSSMLPHKISQSFNEGRNFYNTMPAIIPNIDAAGVKIVSRYPDRNPSIKGELLLYRYSDGECLSLLDATWITAKRTGAVAALAVQNFAKQDFESIAVMGLGQTGRCFLDMFMANPKNHVKTIKLLKYKDHAESVREILLNKGASCVEICQTNEELITNSDVIISAITVSETLIGKDSWYKEGCLVVPIHTRGFQNCDLFFDKVFADDKSHVEGFKHFNEFKQFAEMSDVLEGKASGRESNEERILSYNIGIALHDIYLARRIYDLKLDCK